MADLTPIGDLSSKDLPTCADDSEAILKTKLAVLNNNFEISKFLANLRYKSKSHSTQMQSLLPTLEDTKGPIMGYDMEKQ
jgi:hypothetical protein